MKAILPVNRHFVWLSWGHLGHQMWYGWRKSLLTLFHPVSYTFCQRVAPYCRGIALWASTEHIQALFHVGWLTPKRDNILFIARHLYKNHNFSANEKQKDLPNDQSQCIYVFIKHSLLGNWCFSTGKRIPHVFLSKVKWFGKKIMAYCISIGVPLSSCPATQLNWIILHYGTIYQFLNIWISYFWSKNIVITVFALSKGSACSKNQPATACPASW